MSNADRFWQEYRDSGMFTDDGDVPVAAAAVPVLLDDDDALVRFAQALFQATIIEGERHARRRRRRREGA